MAATRTVMATWLIIGVACTDAGEPSPAERTPEAAPTVDAVDTIFLGGDILTLAGDEPELVEALAVENGRIVVAGAKAKALARRGPETRLVDLEGRTLLPGFVDAHSHLLHTATKLATVSLDPPPAGDVRSIEDIASKLRAEIEARPRGADEWVIGWGFDNGMLAEDRFPTKADLDRVSSDVPILVMHFSSHMLVLNTAGLARAGYDEGYEDPEGGLARRVEGTRTPNGVIEEQAMVQAFTALASDVFGEDVGPRSGISFPDAQMKELIRAAQEIYLSEGFTTITEFAATPPGLQLLKELRDEGALHADVIAQLYFASATLDAVAAEYSPHYDRHLRVGGGKINLDGGSPGKTAYLREPYVTPPPGQPADYRGYSTLPDQDAVDELAAAYYEARVPFFIHALGDAAVDQAIAAVRHAESRFPRDDIRTQLIHLQVLHPDQLDSLAELDVTLTFQNTHNFYFADYHRESTLGPERTERLCPMRSALERGLSVTFHHDSPVHPVSQLDLVWIAANRKSRSGRVYGPEERLSVYEALRAATVEAAYQLREEGTKGTLEEGKLADLVILDRNPLEVDPGALRDLVVMETIKEGETVWKR